jgi:hypothetical protein
VRSHVLVAAAFGLVALAGCSSNGTATDSPATSSATAASSTGEVSFTDAPAPSTNEAPEASEAQVVPPAPAEPPVPEPEAAPPVAAPQPYITGCQMGLGPIETYWSDGTVTGYSDYCQQVHDQVLQGEVEANTPTCDGVVCTYPNGATIPDPNAPAPVEPAPQGSQDRNGDGVISGFERCGTACGEEPTSGEMQAEWLECLEQNPEEYCRETLNN